MRLFLKEGEELNAARAKYAANETAIAVSKMFGPAE